jgi:hypothetical protein
MCRCSWRPVWTCFWDLPISLQELFSGKKQNFWSWDYSPLVLDYQNLWITRHWIKGSLLYFLLTCYQPDIKNFRADKPEQAWECEWHFDIMVTSEDLAGSWSFSSNSDLKGSYYLQEWKFVLSSKRNSSALTSINGLESILLLWYCSTQPPYASPIRTGHIWLFVTWEAIAYVEKGA